MKTDRFSCLLVAAAGFTAILGASASALPRSNRGQSTFAPDKGTFTILVNGKAAGKETFELSPNGQNWLVRGTAEILGPNGAANSATRITGTLQLHADGTPVHYEWSTDGDKQASCAVNFDGLTASVEPHIPGAYPYSQQFTFNSQPIIVLDNNLYDQYGVLARLYDWSKKGVQTFSVLVPQEITAGTVTAESRGAQNIGGKKLEELYVRAEGNELSIFLDAERVVRISVPGANAEIVRE